jgi:DeoR/GlpR family transcriptional regulator of sugar metabolism
MAGMLDPGSVTWAICDEIMQGSIHVMINSEGIIR